VKQKNLDSKTFRKYSPDDIPVALRTHINDGRYQKRAIFPFSRAKLLGLLLILCFGFAVIAYLRVFMLPAPLLGLNARLSSDGRLLGHFPYPEADPKGMVAVAPGLLLAPDAARSFLEMELAAATEGINLIPISAFRPISLQKDLFFNVKAERNQSSIERAQVSAPPGFSEHSTGYAIDIGDQSQPQMNLSPGFVHTRAYQWLKANAARYQFVLSFPENNPQAVNFEPWHWRYEGNTESLRLFEPAQRLGRRHTRSDQQR
jgi:D-alanyl-D-alanine carboxypeptidase